MSEVFIGRGGFGVFRELVAFDSGMGHSPTFRAGMFIPTWAGTGDTLIELVAGFEGFLRGPCLIATKGPLGGVMLLLHAFS